MTNRERVISTHEGGPVSVSIERDGSLLTAILLWHGTRVGYAYLSIDGDVASIQDVWIEERAPKPPGLIRTLLARPRRVRFREHGWGTKLMEAVIDELAGQ